MLQCWRVDGHLPLARWAHQTEAERSSAQSVRRGSCEAAELIAELLCPQRPLASVGMKHAAGTSHSEEVKVSILGWSITSRMG